MSRLKMVFQSTGNRLRYTAWMLSHRCVLLSCNPSCLESRPWSVGAVITLLISSGVSYIRATSSNWHLRKLQSTWTFPYESSSESNTRGMKLEKYVRTGVGLEELQSYLLHIVKWVSMHCLCFMSAQFFQQFIIALLEHSPDLYLDEIQEQLDEQHGIHVSLSTISRTLKRIGITSKKVLYNIDTLLRFLYSETPLAL